MKTILRLIVNKRAVKHFGPFTIALLVAEIVVIAKDHFDRLDERQREELKRLIKESRGRPSNLKKRERKQLNKIVDRLEVAELGKEIAKATVPLKMRRSLRRKKRVDLANT